MKGMNMGAAGGSGGYGGKSAKSPSKKKTGFRPFRAGTSAKPRGFGKSGGMRGMGH